MRFWILALVALIGTAVAAPTPTKLAMRKPVHGGFVDDMDCSACHTTGGWKLSSTAGASGFDHDRTGFPLRGGHEPRACGDCHRGQGRPATTCEGCHRDPHQGQFARGAGGSACERCHTTDNLKASRFDHGRDAAWHLDGAHARVACAACHRPETRNGATFIRYKPLPTTCSGCHGPSGRPPSKEEKP